LPELVVTSRPALSPTNVFAKPDVFFMPAADPMNTLPLAVFFGPASIPIRVVQDPKLSRPAFLPKNTL
jgi:hypothetical protein